MKFFDYGFGVLRVADQIGPISLPCYDLLGVHQGALDLTIHDKKITLSAGEIILIYPSTRFRGRCREACRISVQHFALTDSSPTPQIFDRLQNHQRGYERYRFMLSGELDRDIHRAISLSFMQETPAVKELRVAQLMLILAELDGMVHRSEIDVNNEWRPLIEWLEQHIDRTVSLEDMAHVMGLSVSNFRVRFHEDHDMSPGRYLHQMRIDEAARMLRETSVPIKSIGPLIGYHELASFYRAFRKSVGTTPADYRKACCLNSYINHTPAAQSHTPPKGGG